MRFQSQNRAKHSDTALRCTYAGAFRLSAARSSHSPWPASGLRGEGARGRWEAPRGSLANARIPGVAKRWCTYAYAGAHLVQRSLLDRRGLLGRNVPLALLRGRRCLLGVPRGRIRAPALREALRLPLDHGLSVRQCAGGSCEGKAEAGMAGGKRWCWSRAKMSIENGSKDA